MAKDVNNELNKEASVYDYISINCTRKTEDLIVDIYENLGWEKTSTGFNVVNFKRNHRINHKNELNKINRELNKNIENINRLEKQKVFLAQVVSIVIGIIGTLLFGGGMALILEFNQSLLGIILGVIGILIALPAYSIHKMIFEKNNDKVMRLLEEEYDKITLKCDEAQKYLE